MFTDIVIGSILNKSMSLSDPLDKLYFFNNIEHTIINCYNHFTNIPKSLQTDYINSEINILTYIEKQKSRLK
jgi:hypothetical protein